MKRLACAVLGLLTLAGCASPAPPPAPAAPAVEPGRGFNAADVMFLQMMVPHHEQGLTLVRLARDRASRADLRTLAAAIEATQTDEVRTMSSWLRDWRQPPTAPPGAHQDHGGMPDTTAGEIATLGRITGPDFDRRFLNVMISHQDDAIQLAKLETTTGQHPQAKALAARIDRSRSAQITQMLKLLDGG
ncbi:MAG TPA: DUF305 domain-containing protein [Actinophytocola sp.]|uniref:DUF305 domain-containing protein n=1 Tax=Actinophytocola sp. TaxID=1872138 RepID=UPI002DDD92D4|nr:DUF305 domain-containing protein [Actinophytocola sp.]HEV2783284.1 DUF305 domain-containing protein [Actinophytocola sp.]